MLDKPHRLSLDFSEKLRNQGFVDYYDLLGVAPNANSRTIQRVYRLLAMRFHPANRDSGDSDAFHLVQDAYRVLINSQLRARYDAEYATQVKSQWRLGDEIGIPATQGGRQLAILALLYRVRRLCPDDPGIRFDDLLDLLACDRAVLDATLNTLLLQGLLGYTADGSYFIEAKGVDAMDQWAETAQARDRLPGVAGGIAPNWSSIWEDMLSRYKREPIRPEATSRPDVNEKRGNPESEGQRFIRAEGVSAVGNLGQDPATRDDSPSERLAENRDGEAGVELPDTQPLPPGTAARPAAETAVFKFGAAKAKSSKPNLKFISSFPPEKR